MNQEVVASERVLDQLTKSAAGIRIETAESVATLASEFENFVGVYLSKEQRAVVAIPRSEGRTINDELDSFLGNVKRVAVSGPQMRSIQLEKAEISRFLSKAF